jgi:hypothetical protein
MVIRQLDLAADSDEPPDPTEETAATNVDRHKQQEKP